MVKSKKERGSKGKKGPSGRKPKNEPASYEATINLHKRLLSQTFKNRARKAVKHVKVFAKKIMHTQDVRVDPKLNKFLWSGGIKGVPFRARIRMDRKRSEDEDSKKKLYTVVSWIPVAEYKNLKTQRVDE